MRCNFPFPGSEASHPSSRTSYLAATETGFDRRPLVPVRSVCGIRPARGLRLQATWSQRICCSRGSRRARAEVRTRAGRRQLGFLLAWLLGFELALSGQTNQPPTVEILNTALRPGTTYIDVDFRVVDPDDETVAVGALGWLNSGSRLEHLIPIRTLVEGTHPNRGMNVPANRPLRLTWNIAADSDVTLASVQVETRAKDQRSPVPLHWVTLPADGPYPAATYLRGALSRVEVASVLLWELALGNPERTIQRDYCRLTNFCRIDFGGDPPAFEVSSGPRLVAAGALASYGVLAQDVIATGDAYIGISPAAMAFVMDRLGMRLARPEEIRPNLDRYGIPAYTPP